MIVRADELGAGQADQERSCDQVMRASAALIAETALADEGNRMALVPLHERLVARHRRATEIGHRHRPTLEQGRGAHAPKSSYASAAGQPAAARRTGF